MRMIIRDKDMVFGNKDLEEIYTMRNFPVYCGVTTQDEGDDQFADMKWMISSGSGMIQLGELLPPDVLYSISHNSSFGGIWKKHHEEFAEFLNKYTGKVGILEVGGGNGILNATYGSRFGNNLNGEGIPWTIVDPSQVNIVYGCTAKYIKKLFDSNVDLSDIDYDTIVHSHLLEHQYDINYFMQICSDNLRNGMRMIFTLPDLNTWLNRKYSNALFFEHTYLITEDYVDYILGKHGFSILEKKSFNNGHSLFYATEKTEITNKCSRDFSQLYIDNKNAFDHFVNHFKELTIRYNEEIWEKDSIYLFGAHIFSQMLINFGLNTEKIISVLDNDPLKQGKRLYGTRFMVESPKVLKNKKEPIVILNAGAYTEEIESDIKDNINSSAVIIK